MPNSTPYQFINKGKVTAKAPSNIALIKYWGKYDGQIPANASVSYTLKNCHTQTEILFKKSEQLGLDFTFEGKKNKSFQQKIYKYLQSIEQYIPFVNNYHFSISSKNTFPHSSGIASSASAFAALALGLIEIEKILLQKDEIDFEKASFLARLGSGSASRSVYKGLVTWGKNPYVKKSSDEFAIPYPEKIPPSFLAVKDAIILIHEGEKSVSSTVGHSLMNNHPFAENRFKQAQENFVKFNQCLQNEDFWSLGQLIEEEALTLHAMMMASSPSFILMKPNTVAVIESIRKFRNDENIPVFFTLDAGANVHVLYPKTDEIVVESFIHSTLKPFTANGNIIFDEVDF